MNALRGWFAVRTAERTDLAVAAAATVFACGGLAMSAASPQYPVRALPVAFYLLSLVCGGGCLARGAASAVSQRRPCTQMLALVAASGTAASGRLGKSALPLAMFSQADVSAREPAYESCGGTR